MQGTATNKGFESKLDRNYNNSWEQAEKPNLYGCESNGSVSANRRVQQSSNAGNNAMRFEEITYNFGTMNQGDRANTTLYLSTEATNQCTLAVQ